MAEANPKREAKIDPYISVYHRPYIFVAVVVLYKFSLFSFVHVYLKTLLNSSLL